MPLAWGGGIFGGGGGGAGSSGTGAAGRVALWTGPGTIGGDSGLTYSGTGATFTVYSTRLFAHVNNAGPLIKLDTLGFRDGGRITFNGSGGESDPSIYAPDLSLSRISAGVVGVGTGAWGSEDGGLSASTLSLRGGASVARVWLQAGIPGDVFFTLGGTGGAGANQVRLGMSSGAITVGNTGYFGFTNNYYSYQLDPDLILTRRAAATLQLGAADSATPVAQTLAVQSATGTNVAGQPFTVQASLGTGTAGGGDYKIRTAPREATGSTQNTPSDRLVLAAKQVTLTESSATPILDVAVASGTVAGGTVWYTIRADDATDFQSFRGQVQWAAVNKGGVLTASIAAVGADAVATSSGTLTSTATITTGTNSITINLNAVSSLTQTTLYAFVSSQLDGTGVVTTK